MDEKQEILKQKMLEYIELIKQCKKKVKEIEELNVFDICNDNRYIQITGFGCPDPSETILLKLADLFKKDTQVICREDDEYPYERFMKVNGIKITTIYKKENSND